MDGAVVGIIFQIKLPNFLKALQERRGHLSRLRPPGLDEGYSVCGLRPGPPYKMSVTHSQ